MASADQNASACAMPHKYLCLVAAWRTATILLLRPAAPSSTGPVWCSRTAQCDRKCHRPAWSSVHTVAGQEQLAHRADARMGAIILPRQRNQTTYLRRSSNTWSDGPTSNTCASTCHCAKAQQVHCTHARPHKRRVVSFDRPPILSIASTPLVCVLLLRSKCSSSGAPPHRRMPASAIKPSS
jgi:hypothetical protein